MGHTWEFSIWFPSEDECWSVLTEVNTIYDRVKATEGYCQVTEFASKIVKRYGNYHYSAQVPPEHKATAYCKPVYIDRNTQGLY